MPHFTPKRLQTGAGARLATLCSHPFPITPTHRTCPQQSLLPIQLLPRATLLARPHPPAPSPFDFTLCDCVTEPTLPQPGSEGPLDPCPAFFFGLVSRLFPSPRLCDIVMLNTTDLPSSPSLQLAVLLVWNAFYPSSESLEQFSLNREVEFQGPDFHPALGLPFFHKQRPPVSWPLRGPMAGEPRATACPPLTRGIPWMNSDELNGLSRLPEAELTQAQNSPKTS